MKKYICDICGNEMPDERCLMVPLERFDDDEMFNLKLKDNCGYRDADICVYCEDKIREALYQTVTKIRAGKDGMECEHINDDGDCLCNWSGCKICMGPNNCSGFSRKEEFMNSSMSDEEMVKRCKYRDPEKETCGCIDSFYLYQKCKFPCTKFDLNDSEKEES